MEKQNALFGSFLGSVRKAGDTQVELEVFTKGGGEEALDNIIGSFALIDAEGMGVFTQLLSCEAVPDSDNTGETTLHIVTLDMLAAVNYEDGAVQPGVSLLPIVGQKAYFAAPELVKKLVRPKVVDNSPIEVDLGIVHDEVGSSFKPSPEQLFGKHCAVLGTTGSGKSWTLARLLEQLSQFNSKVILFDATGEFRDLKSGVVHVHIGDSKNKEESSQEVTLPFHQLMEGDLLAIFRPKGQCQAPKLRAAIRSLKLLRLAPHIGIDGMIMKANRQKRDYNEAYLDFRREIESPTLNFDINNLAQQIQNECVALNRSAVEQNFWGSLNGNEISDCLSLISRVDDAVQSKNLYPIFNPGRIPSLLGTIDEFLCDAQAKILRISLEHLSFEHGVRQIVANAAGRKLFEMARDERFLNKPCLAVIDEAHQFLAKPLEEANDDFPLDSFNLIAKEGRKYSLNICLATQRPRDIPEDVLSQIGTFISHRLINDFDRNVIERACSEIDHSVNNYIPKLTPGNAVVFGMDFHDPIVIGVSEPRCKPKLSGPDFQKNWK